MRAFLYGIVLTGSLCGLIAPHQTLAAEVPAKEVFVTDKPEQAPAPAGLSITKLPNGLMVAIQKDDRFPLAALRLYVHAGSAYETPEHAGISHQLEHMVFKGTGKRPKAAAAAEVEKAGGYLNAATSFDYTVYLADMPSDQWALGLDVLKDMAFHPSLNPQELEAEKKVVLAELQRGEDSPGDRLFRRIQALALAGTSYERPIIGYPETIRNFTAEGIRAYIARHHQPQAMMLVVVGRVDPDKVLAEATRLFGDIPNNRVIVPPAITNPAVLPAKGPVLTVEHTPWNKVHLGIAFPIYDQNDPRSPALEVLSHLLAGDKTSYFYRVYKYDKQLVDSISVGSYSFERTGLLYISVSLAPDKLSTFWREFNKDLATISRLTFTQEELNRAKLNLEDSLYRHKETLGGLASKLGYFLFFGGPAAENNYLAQLKLTDQATLTQLMRTLLRPEHLSAAVLLPEKTEAKPGIPAMPTEGWLRKTLSDVWPKADSRGVADRHTGKGKPEIVDLSSGRTLILLPDPTLPYTAVDMVFNGGDALLPPGKQGLGTLSAAVLTRGSLSMSAPALDSYLADRASSLRASSGRQTFSLAMRYPTRFTENLFGLLQTVLTKPAFAKDEVDRAKKNQEAAIISQEDRPFDLASRRLFPFLFGSHPYGYVGTGTLEAVRAYGQEDVRAFWAEQMRQPWAMAICGDFDREAVIKAAKALPVPSAKASSLKIPAWSKDKILDVPLKGRQQAHLFLVFPGVEPDNPDAAGLDLLQTILAGQSGILFRDLRDGQGLGYVVTAFSLRFPLTSALVLYTGTEPDKLAQVEDGFRKIIMELHKTTLPEAELTRGKNQMAGQYIRSRQSLGSRSQEAATLIAIGRPINAEQDKIEKARTLTPKDLQHMARTYLDLNKAYTLRVLP